METHIFMKEEVFKMDVDMGDMITDAQCAVLETLLTI